MTTLGELARAINDRASDEIAALFGISAPNPSGHPAFFDVPIGQFEALVADATRPPEVNSHRGGCWLIFVGRVQVYSEPIASLAPFKPPTWAEFQATRRTLASVSP